jgi:hypothetical protein
MKKYEIRDNCNNQLIFKVSDKGILYFRRQDKEQVLLPWCDVLIHIPNEIITNYLDATDAIG